MIDQTPELDSLNRRYQTVAHYADSCSRLLPFQDGPEYTRTYAALRVAQSKLAIISGRIDWVKRGFERDRRKKAIDKNNKQQ